MLPVSETVIAETVTAVVACSVKVSRTLFAVPAVRTVPGAGSALPLPMVKTLAGLSANWLENLFRFAPRPAERVIARPSGKEDDGKVDGFIGYVCKQITGKKKGHASREIVERTTTQLRTAALRANTRLSR